MIELILPWPPSVNTYKKVGALTTTRNGKLYQTRVNTQETKDFYYYVWLKIRELNWFKRKMKPIETTLEATIHLYPPDCKKRDIDNVIKPLLDSLVKGQLIKDDSQFSRLLIERCSIIDKGQVIIKIQELL
jgi:crossover junction endodeoxyribonuclease RusA